MSEKFVVYDIERGHLRERALNAVNGPRVMFNEVPRAGKPSEVNPDFVQLRLGSGPAAHLDRVRAAAVIEILAFWLATGRLWMEEGDDDWECLKCGFLNAAGESECGGCDGDGTALGRSVRYGSRRLEEGNE